MTDVQEKYQKLSSEFAKIRSQIPVLKKAVLDEKANGSLLQEKIKMKEHDLRKSEQEIDSLRFRNQQMSTRVEMLQKELEELISKSKKSKKQPTTNSNFAVDSVISEELQSKIQENAELHNQLFEMKQTTKEYISALEDELHCLKNEAGKHQNMLDENINTYTQQIEQLEKNVLLLQVKLEKCENEKFKNEENLKNLDILFKRSEEKVLAELTMAKNVIHQKIPFDDSSEKGLNSLNLSVVNRSLELYWEDTLSTLSIAISGSMQALSNWLTYMEQRIYFFSTESSKESISDVTKQLCEHLHSSNFYTKPVVEYFNQFVESKQKKLESAQVLQNFSRSFQRFVAYMSKLLPYQILNLEEENKASACTLILRARNRELIKAFQCLERALTKLESTLSFVIESCISNKLIYNKYELHIMISNDVKQLVTCFQGLAKQYHSKINLENELSTCSEKLEVNNESLMSELTSLVNVSNKVYKLVKAACDLFSMQNEFIFSHSGLNQKALDLRQRSSNYLSSLQESMACAESVPYEVAVFNRKTLRSSTKSVDNLAEQNVKLQEKLVKCEQQKEHWMLEAKLLQMKLEKQSLLDQERCTACNHDASNTERENFIKQYYEEKISDLLEKVQLADSKALHFYVECGVVHKRLEVVHCDTQNLLIDAENNKDIILNLKDELKTTTNNYEGQLSMFSEHLAGMNEKITLQKDTIEELKYQLQNNTKGTKKGFLKKH